MGEPTGGGSVGERLRVAIIVPASNQPAWVARLAKELQSDPRLIVSVLLQPDAEEAERAHPARVTGFLQQVFQRYDRRRVPTDKDPARQVDLSGLAGTAPEVDGSADPRQRLAAGVSLLRGDPHPSLVEMFEHGLITVSRAGAGREDPTPAALLEVLSGEPALHFSLLHWKADARTATVLQHVCIRTDRMSVLATASRYYRHLALLLAARLPSLAAGEECPARGAEPDAGRPKGAAPAAAAPRPATPPVARSLLRMATLRVSRGIRARNEREDWALAVVRGGATLASPLDLDPASPHQRPHLLLPPSGKIWADPFPIQRGPRLYVFFEEMASGARGQIAVMELGGDLQPRDVRPVLTAPYHLSYPFVFEWRGSLFMVPETEQNRTVEVHRCVAWPDTWTLEAVLLQDVSAADATLVEAGGRWWMFATMNPARDVDWNTNLYLFHAPTPLGPWSPHRCNPVKSDVRNSRSAGRLFWRDGKLYRPTQDCAVRYGHSLVLNEVDRLDPGTFREHDVHRIMPGWQPDVVGVHTVNQHGDLYLIDCKLRRRRGT